MLSVFPAKGELKEFRQTFYCTLAELARQVAVIEKDPVQNFGDGEDKLTVGDRIENRFLEVMAKLQRLCIERTSGSYCATAVRLHQDEFIPQKRQEVSL